MAGQRNEGEGNKTAARRYNEKTEAFSRSGKVDEKAREAAKALEGDKRQELERAEQAGKARAKEHDPQARRDYRKPS